MRDLLPVCGLVVALVAFNPDLAPAAVPETVITEPVSVAQYGDAIVVYVHGFDRARAHYANLQLRYRLVFPDGTAGAAKILDLTQPWEKPGIILRKDETEYAGIVLSASGGTNVFFRRFYSFGGELTAPTLVPTLARNAAVELGQFMSEAPEIPLPDRAQFQELVIGAAARSFDLDAGLRQVRSSINYPQVSSGQLCALSRQTDFPDDDTKRSLYVPLKSQLFDQQTGQPAGVAHYLCEIPLDPSWLNGTNDLTLSLTASQIKVHRSDETDNGTNILGGGGGGLGQSTGTMDVDADGNIYFSGSVPTDVVRFNISQAAFEVPPTDLLPLSNRYLPTDDEILGNGDTTTKNGRWQTYRMVASMNHSHPKRMLYARTISKLIFDGTLYEWSALFTLPTDHWDDPVAFTNEFRLLVGSWPSAQHSFYDTLPVTDGPLRRIQYFKSYGNSVYAQPYPNSIGGPWRVDITGTNTVAAFGTPETWSGSDAYQDGTSKAVDAKPYNAAVGNRIQFRDYGLLTMDREDLHYCLTGANNSSLTGQIEVSYDAIAHMIENAAEFQVILDNIGGPSLAPAYMSTPLPGQNGKLLGVGEYGYYLAEFDLNETTPGAVDKEFLTLASPDPNVDLPLAVGLGPYGYQWVNLAGDDWLYIGGYIGLTRLKYSENGAPRQRHAMHKFDTQLATVNLDAAGSGPIKRYRYLQHGLDNRMFLTGTHTAARGGTAYSGGLLSFDQTNLDTIWRLSYMSRNYWTLRLRNRIVRDLDGVPIQEFVSSSFFDDQYTNTIPAELAPTNREAKVFMWDYKSGGQMRDLMGFSQASLQGESGVSGIVYSRDRRYLIIRQGPQLLTFDPQTRRFIDGKTLNYGGDPLVANFARPSYSFTRSPDDRLFLHLRPSDTSTNALFLEVLVSPEGALSVNPYLEFHAASEAIVDDSFNVQHTYLPDHANADGSYDLMLGQQHATSGGGTVCWLIKDFVPPRRHALERSLNVLSRGQSGVAITGTKPGMTPYRATTTDGQNITLSAAPSAGFVLSEWQDEAGNVLGTDSTLQIRMSVDRVVTAVLSPRPSVPANSTNLVITEIHYHPSAPTAAESAAGYRHRDQFEFIELMNSSHDTIDLSAVSLVEANNAGIYFPFSISPRQNLGPGERILLVSDRDAFSHRYGSNLLAQVAGEYAGTLNDDGDLLVLFGANNTIIHNFAFDDEPPWPTAPDGQGFSLRLIRPTRQPPPDPHDPANWRSSRSLGGSPGAGSTSDYATWKTGFGIAANDPEADLDNDGRLNIVEYLQNTDPTAPNQMNGMTAAIESIQVGGNTNPYFVFRILRRLDADDLEILVDTSDNLATWTANQTIFLGRQREPHAPTEWLRYRTADPIRGINANYVRLRVRVRD